MAVEQRLLEALKTGRHRSERLRRIRGRRYRLLEIGRHHQSETRAARR